MRRTVAGAALGAVLLAMLAACHESVGVGACYESGATAYPVHAPGDTTAVFRWPDDFQPVRFYAEPVGSLQANVDAGMQLWVNAFRCHELTLQRVSDSTTADIVIRNPGSLPPPANAITVAADSVGACRGRTDVSLDTLGRLTRPIRVYVVPSNIDSVAVAACYHFVTAHEIGHTLGLFSHSSDPADLMYAVPRRTALSINDRYTIQLLYHVDAPVKPEPR